MSDKTKLYLFSCLGGIGFSIPFMYFMDITGSDLAMIFAALAGFGVFTVYRDVKGEVKEDELIPLLVITAVSIILALILSVAIAASQFMDLFDAFKLTIEAVFKDPMAYLENTWIAFVSGLAGAYYALNNQEKFYWTFLKK